MRCARVDLVRFQGYLETHAEISRMSFFFPTAVATIVSIATTFVDDRDGSERPPNIVLLLADDAGYADFGFQQDDSPIAEWTPHLDRLAQEGARLTNFYMAAAICSPSRAGLLTGRYPQRFGHERNILPGTNNGLPLDQVTMADRLQERGYRTACVGKWHLGYAKEYHPNRRGFDWFYGCLAGSRSYFPLEESAPVKRIQENGAPTAEKGYLTDRLASAAVRFIGETKDQPFFLYLSFTAPHSPPQAKPEDLARIQGAELSERRRVYAAMVKSMDDAVGQVLAALDEQGIADNTLVVFTNDNGGQTRMEADNTPLRGKKGDLQEGGIRVPCVVRWPGHVEPGAVIEQPAISLDLLPTFLEVAGTDGSQEGELDGVTLASLWSDEGMKATPPERALYWRSFGPSGPIALRSGRWKLSIPGPPKDEGFERRGAPRLYDLDQDPGEANDLAGSQPDLVHRLRRLLEEWEGLLESPRWESQPER